MGRLLLSVTASADEMGAAFAPHVRDWALRLRESGFRACFFFHPQDAERLLTADAADVLDTLRTHDLGLLFEPDTDADRQAVPRAEQWWGRHLRSLVYRAASGVWRLSRVFGRPPVAGFCPSGLFLPQAAMALAYAGVPVYAHAPLEGRRRGQPLRYGQATLLTSHFSVAELAVPKSKATPTLSRELSGRDGDIFLDAHLALAPLSSGRREQRQRIERWPARVRDRLTAWLGAYAELAVQPPVCHLTAADVRRLATGVEACLHPVEVAGHWLSLAEMLTALIAAGQGLAATGAVPERVSPLAVAGPVPPPPVLPEMLVRRQTLLGACAAVAAELRQTGRIPTTIDLAGYRTSPAAFLWALARVIDGAAPSVKVPAGSLPQQDAGRKAVRAAAERLAALWPARNAARLVRHALLQQCWTAKPF